VADRQTLGDSYITALPRRRAGKNAGAAYKMVGVAVSVVDVCLSPADHSRHRSHSDSLDAARKH